MDLDVLKGINNTQSAYVETDTFKEINAATGGPVNSRIVGLSQQETQSIDMSGVVIQEYYTANATVLDKIDKSTTWTDALVILNPIWDSNKLVITTRNPTGEESQIPTTLKQFCASLDIDKLSTKQINDLFERFDDVLFKNFLYIFPIEKLNAILLRLSNDTSANLENINRISAIIFVKKIVNDYPDVDLNDSMVVLPKLDPQKILNKMTSLQWLGVLNFDFNPRYALLESIVNQLLFPISDFKKLGELIQHLNAERFDVGIQGIQIDQANPPLPTPPFNTIKESMFKYMTKAQFDAYSPELSKKDLDVKKRVFYTGLQKGGTEPGSSEEEEDLSADDIKEMISYVYGILLDLNFYSNPAYLDIIYHYIRLMMGRDINVSPLFGNFIDVFKIPEKTNNDDIKEISETVIVDPIQVGKNEGLDVYDPIVSNEYKGPMATDRADHLFRYTFDPMNNPLKKTMTNPDSNPFKQTVVLTRNGNAWKMEKAKGGKGEGRSYGKGEGRSYGKGEDRSYGKGEGQTGGQPPETPETPTEQSNRYLHDNVLAREIEDCVDESVDRCTVYICAYSLETAPRPFLKFAVSKKDNTYTFPHFTATTQDFKCQLYNELFTAFGISIQGKEDQTCADMTAYLESVYKGIKYHKIQGTDAVFAFFDYAAIHGGNMVADYPASPFQWAIVDELVFERTICGVYPVDPVITEMFARYDILWNIMDAADKWLDFPFAVYSVVVEEGTELFANVPVPVDKESAKLEQDAVINPPQLDVYGREDEYGQRYCFTYKPISTEPNPKRYAVFAVEPEYVETAHNTDDAERAPDEIDEKILAKMEKPVIYFKANNKYTKGDDMVMWGILNTNYFTVL